MQKRDLVPSIDNVYETFCNDSIGRNEELLHFVHLLNSITGPYSVALDGRWGSGKTFFVKQAKMLFDAFNPFSQLSDHFDESQLNDIKSTWKNLTLRWSKKEWEPSLQLCVYFDAWEYDSEKDPIAALLYHIAKVTHFEYELENSRNNFDIIGSVFDAITGRNIKDALYALKGEKTTDSIKNSYDLRSHINEYFSGLLPEHGDRLIIFIDELDRCNPSFAVKLLERIKHYFANEKITFVFSLNMEQMQHTVRGHYGEGFDAHRYIERFFDLPIPMPKLKRSKFESYLEYDFTHRGVLQTATTFAEINHMEMREATRYYATINMITQVAPTPSRMSSSWWFCYHLLIPIAVGLQKIDISAYHRFVAGEDSSPLMKLLSVESILECVLDLFPGTTADTAHSVVEQAYTAIFIDAKHGGSKTICERHFNERTHSYFMNTIGLLNANTVLE